LEKFSGPVATFRAEAVPRVMSDIGSGGSLTMIKCTGNRFDATAALLLTAKRGRKAAWHFLGPGDRHRRKAVQRCRR
jgi:hypothetical protein